MQYRIQFLDRSGDVIREWSANAQSVARAVALIVEADWPPRAVTMRVLDMIHASKGMTRAEYERAAAFMAKIGRPVPTARRACARRDYRQRAGGRHRRPAPQPVVPWASCAGARRRKAGAVHAGARTGGPFPSPVAMIKIAITVEAFEATARTLPLGSVGYENKTNERGEKLIWLEHEPVN